MATAAVTAAAAGATDQAPARRHALGVLALAACFAWQLAWMGADVELYDEGLVLFGASRVLRGDVPYRDFWTLYGPASFYAVAGLFRLVGEHAIALRLVDIAVKTAIVGLVWALVADGGRHGARGRIAATVAAVFATGVVVQMGNHGVPLFPAVALGLAALVGLRRVASDRAPRDAALGGLAIGLAILFRHDLGLAAAVAGAALLGAAGWADTSAGGRRQLARASGVVAAATLAVVLPAAIALLVAVPIGDLLYCLVTVPVDVYPHVRALPFPSPAGAARLALEWRSRAPLWQLVVWVPPLAIAAAAAAALASAAGRRRAGRRSVEPQDAVLLGVAVLLVLYTAKGFVRVQPFQMGIACLAMAVLGGLGAQRIGRASWRRAAGVAAAAVAVALLVRPAWAAATAGPARTQAWVAHASSLCADRTLPRLVCLRLDPDRAAVARWLLAHGSAGRPLYVGAGRHDRLLKSDVALYVAAEGVAATRWHDLHPGVQTTDAIQRQMVADLARTRPAFVVLDRRWDDETEPNASAVPSGETRLDRYLAARYVRAFAAGEVDVLVPMTEERRP